MKEIFSISFSVFYEDTDSSGFTYHTSYLKFAERARSIMVKENFKEIFDKMLKNTFFFVVRKITVKYIKPSFLSDELLVKTYFLKSNKVSLDLKQIILKNGKPICEILVKLVWIDGKLKKPCKIPKNLITRFNSHVVV
jgi:acyl-CoA thioester hydrolase|tara:strand:- start:3211 stop:3624 length:414 start_codon:yes stop_codon:yes gene_type:complete